MDVDQAYKHEVESQLICSDMYESSFETSIDMNDDWLDFSMQVSDYE